MKSCFVHQIMFAGENCPMCESVSDRQRIIDRALQAEAMVAKAKTDHPDIFEGKAWPDSMGIGADDDWYIEHYRDGRVFLRVYHIFDKESWREFLIQLAGCDKI